MGTPGSAVDQRVTLRSVEPEDLPHFYRWDNDPEIVALLGKKFRSPHHCREWYRSRRSSLHHRVWAIVAEDGRLIGEVELAHIHWRSGSAELSICIGEKTYWDRGYGGEAVRLVAAQAFGGLGLRELYLRVYSSNRRAIRCYERSGFRTVGRLKRSRRYAHPRQDVLLMTLERDGLRVAPRRVASLSP